MRILFDFRIYEYSLSRGIGRYVYCLVDHILKNFSEIEISIIKANRCEKPIFNYNNDKIKYYFFDELENYNFDTKFDFYFLDDILSTGGNKIKFLDTFFDDLFPEKILKNSKKVVSIGYDLVPLLFYNIYLFDNNFINQYLCHLETVYIQDAIFVISESTKDDFVKYLNIDEKKITNIYGGFDPKFNNLNKYTYNFHKRKNNIVFTSAYDDLRKNALKLIKGFAIAYNDNKIPRDSKLYLCGKVSKEYDKIVEEEMINNNITNENIIITGFITDDKLIELITKSKATILPSLYEGLGLTILESYACNTPAFASNISATKEFVLEECSFDPYNEEDIANAIIIALTNEELCIKSTEFGKKLLEEKCNWDIVSKKVVSKLYELMGYIDIDNALFTNNISYSNPYKNSHVFTALNTADNIRNLNNSITNKKNNNTIIPIEYYNKFQDKYNYKKKTFVFDDTKFNINIINTILNEQNNETIYLLFQNTNIFQTLFIYLNNNLITLKKYIQTYYNNYFNLIEKISNEKSIFNILQENNIYGFAILLDILKIYNVVIYNDSIKKLILCDLEKSNLKDNINIVFVK